MGNILSKCQEINPICGFTSFTEVIPWFYLPTGPVREYNVTLFITSFNESHTCVLFPVPHGLLEHGSLATWKSGMTLIKVSAPERGAACWPLQHDSGWAVQTPPLSSIRECQPSTTSESLLRMDLHFLIRRSKLTISTDMCVQGSINRTYILSVS